MLDYLVVMGMDYASLAQNVADWWTAELQGRDLSQQEDHFDWLMSRAVRLPAKAVGSDALVEELRSTPVAVRLRDTAGKGRRDDGGPTSGLDRAANAILVAALQWCIVTGADDFSQTTHRIGLAEGINEGVDQIIDWASSGENNSSGKLVLTITGLHLEATAPVSLPWGTWFPVRTARSGNRDYWSRRTAALLVTDTACVVETLEQDGPTLMSVIFRSSEREGTLHRLALAAVAVIGAGAELRVAVSSAHTWHAFGGNFGSAHSPAVRDYRENRITAALVGDYCAAASAIAALDDVMPHPSRLDIFSEAVVKAVGSTDSRDKVVNCVLAWESLFGVQGETTFQVCAGVASALYPVDVQARRVAFEQLKTIYDARSKIVHGDPGGVKQLADKAAFAFAATCQLVSWALACTPMEWGMDNRDRVKAMLLGGSRPSKEETRIPAVTAEIRVYGVKLVIDA